MKRPLRNRTMGVVRGGLAPAYSIEFMGDATVRGSRAVLSPDGSDTWYEYGIGANFNVNKNTYVYADIERTTGAALDEDWRANVGVRYSF